MEDQNAGSKELRAALDAPDGFASARHRERTEDVRQKHPHSVRYVGSPQSASCLTYALSLYQKRKYLAIAGAYFNYKIFAGKTFAEWLIERLDPLNTAKPGCLVMYSKAGVWTHAGIAAGSDRVTSKWGTFPAYEHERFEIPDRYGDEIRHFVLPEDGRALDLFIEFCRSEYGLTDEDIADALEYERP